MTVPLLEQHAIRHLVKRLGKRYAGRHDEETIRRTVEEIERRYQDANVHTFVPLLVERDAKRVLDRMR
ncbi:three-helix bundle dimerization domain-containing protein [Dactylosporangium sp. CA-092794]|uniref:three-helix bundle dimerization domain-containing protein n=1 Tax=Dactylosporangium sp. CA-092794 TaxID=3239929 RepID=UPI003D90344C